MAKVKHVLVDVLGEANIICLSMTFGRFHAIYFVS